MINNIDMNRLQTKTGGVIISVILGLGLSTLFAKSCGKNCTVIKPVDPSQMVGKSFKYDNQCVKFVPEYSPCKK